MISLIVSGAFVVFCFTLSVLCAFSFPNPVEGFIYALVNAVNGLLALDSFRGELNRCGVKNE